MLYLVGARPCVFRVFEIFYLVPTKSTIFYLVAGRYTGKPLHRETLTHRSFYTQKLLHTEAFTQRNFYAQELLHTGAFTHRSLYTRRLLHTEAFTQRSLLDTDAFAQRNQFNRAAFTCFKIAILPKFLTFGHHSGVRKSQL